MIKNILLLCAATWTLSAQNFEDKIAAVKNRQIAEARAEWFGFNPQDSTEALKKALNSGARKVIVSRQVSPWIVSEPLDLPGNFELFLEKGAEIRAAKGAFKGIADVLIHVRKRQNVIIRGEGTLVMNRADYQDKTKYQPAEWRHTIGLFASSDIRIEGITIRDSGGDGIYVHSVKNLLVDNITADGHLRQGISVITGEDITIRNSRFLNTSGMMPMSGIDFEPNLKTEKLVRCVVENCDFINNKGSGIEIVLLALDSRSTPVSIMVKNCRINGNSNGILISNHRLHSVRGSILFENCRVTDSGNNTFISMGQTADGFRVTLRNCLFDNTKSANPAFQFLAGYIGSGAVGNLHCDNVKVIEPRDRPIFVHAELRLHPFKNMSGTLHADRGRSVVFSKLLEQSEREKPFKEAQVAFDKLKIKTKNTIAGGAPLRVRFSGTFLQYARTGENITVEAKMFLIGAGRNHSGHVTLKSPDGTILSQTVIPPQSPTKEITFRAPKSGVYKLEFSSPGNAMEFRSRHHGNGYLAQGVIRGNTAPARMSFVVPAGVKDVAVKVAGDGDAETISAALIDPQGKTVVQKKKISTGSLLYYQRINAHKEEVWTIDIADVMEDFNLTLLGDLIPILSLSPILLGY